MNHCIQADLVKLRIEGYENTIWVVKYVETSCLHGSTWQLKTEKVSAFALSDVIFLTKEESNNLFKNLLTHADPKKALQANFNY